ncbi:MAG: glycosyltransferase family 4 protein [Psychrosphaera sp.]|nr:glycosyltransferase family 4 protein [Psychrosphaera sp.]
MRKIILTLDSSQMGGIETHVLTLAAHLSDEGYDVEVWFIKQYQGNLLYQFLDEHNVSYRFCGSVKGYWLQLWRHRHGIILHTHGYKAGIVGRVFARTMKIPVLSTYHSGDVGTGKLRFYTWLDQLTARLGERIAVSQPIKEMLPKGTKMIPNFINVAQPRVKSNALQPLRVAFVGRLSKEKGPDQFCKMAADWHSDRPVEFVVYGDGPQRTRLLEEFSDRVRFKGYVNMKKHWQNVDVLCISSRYEGLPYVALEAMALGIPVVSFAVGGIGDLISEPSLGWLVEAGNIAKLKQALTQWYDLSDSDKICLSQNVREKIRKQYSTAALVPSIEAIYRSYKKAECNE